MKPWVVDAKDIEPEDLDQFSGQLLHLNNQIADFLDPATTEAVLVIAPKALAKRCCSRPSASRCASAIARCSRSAPWSTSRAPIRT
jgi:hypothetical protein